ncbi:hypothetical protein OG225_42105 (plasmid) [Nocardia sp. NBC_01377]|uniref:hypothetical protein n=1 Tax=Nocardia sp. NBC_01377 TaxID=2903595 RepID=UPI002F918FF9
MDEVCDFAAVPRPNGPVARDLLSQWQVRLDQVPFGALATVSDLWDVASQNDADPPISDAVVAALFDISGPIARLGPDRTRDAVGQLGVARATVELAWRMASAESALRFDGDTRPWLGIEELVAVLTGRPALQWGSREMSVMTVALQLHLALIGDALLRISEWPAPALSWHQHQDVLVASQELLTSPDPLRALVRVVDDPDRELLVALFPAEAPRPRHWWDWEVGQRTSTGFVSAANGREPSLLAARFAAQGWIAEISGRADAF